MAPSKPKAKRGADSEAALAIAEALIPQIEPRGPARTFQENIRVAKGFVKLQFYIKDLLENGGKESVQKIGEWANDLFRDLGVITIAEKAKKEVTEQAKLAEKREVEEKIEEFLESNREEIVRFVRDALEVKSAYERGLGLQAIVISVSAFEEYVHQVTVERVAASKAVESRFKKELDSNLRYNHFALADGDSRRALGEAIAGSFSYTNSTAVLNHLRKLTGSRLVQDPMAWKKRLDFYQAYRHVAVHSAGLADPQFVQTVGYKGAVGKPVQISREFSEAAIAFFETAVDAIERESALRGSDRRGPALPAGVDPPQQIPLPPLPPTPGSRVPGDPVVSV